MPPSSSDPEQSPPSSSASGRPRWAGYWRVVRYGGEAPESPTYYDATRASWDVLTETASGWSVARHPILEIREEILVLKDKGAPDDASERWRVEVDGDRLRVTALTGPHDGAVGVADRIDEDPRPKRADT
jgi:hypothetical protein